MAFLNSPVLSLVLFGMTSICGSAAFVKHDTAITSSNVNHICELQNLVSGNHPNPVDCHTYIECSNGVTTIIACPKGTVYDKVIKICNYESVTFCDTNPTTKPSNATTAARVLHEKDICRERQYPDGIYPDPFHCNKYIDCVGGLTYTMSCPSLLKFDKYLNNCVDPAKARCDTDTSLTL